MEESRRYPAKRPGAARRRCRRLRCPVPVWAGPARPGQAKPRRWRRAPGIPVSPGHPLQLPPERCRGHPVPALPPLPAAPCRLPASHSPQGADETVDRALGVEGHDVPDIQKAGHFLRHFASFSARAALPSHTCTPLPPSWAGGWPPKRCAAGGEHGPGRGPHCGAAGADMSAAPLPSAARRGFPHRLPAPPRPPRPAPTGPGPDRAAVAAGGTGCRQPRGRGTSVL